ncbi:MAG: S8 family peptidase [Planctomycetota bacterium]|jgi:subtilisin family serine protease
MSIGFSWNRCAALLAALSVTAITQAGERPAGPGSHERVLVKFRPHVAAEAQFDLHGHFGHAVERTIHQIDLQVIKVPPGKSAEDVVARYEKHPHVEFVEVESFLKPTLVPDDPWYTNWQMDLQFMDAEAAWDVTTGSASVPIAVIDTGIQKSHFEFVDRVADGSIYGWDFADDDPDYEDELGHGTATTGVIAAATNNGMGMAGASWQNPVMVLRSAFGLDGIEAIIWAADNGARVISMSFGGYTVTAYEAACQYAFDHGVVLVAGAGNDGVDQPFYPAAYSSVLAVTGVDGNGDPVGYNYGDWVDLAAPGALTTVRMEDDSNGDGLSFVGGTSISAPYVAAAAGLILSVNPDLTPTQVMNILRDTADDMADPGFDPLTGHGRVNFSSAVAAASDTPGDIDVKAPVVEIVTPVGGEDVSGSVTIAAESFDDTSVSRVDLYLDGAFFSSDGTAPHEWILDTTTLSNDEHYLYAVAYDPADNSGASDPIFFTVTNAPPDVCNLDGICDGAEDCSNCPADCPETSGAWCGNGICEAGNGEDCVNCPEDCNGKTNGPPGNRFCCGGGDHGVPCSDSRCSDSGVSCSEEPASPQCCGDGVCGGGEDGCSCATDCGVASSLETDCADGSDNDCDALADCDDPDCDGAAECVSVCDGDGVCETGEDCHNCGSDCAGRTNGQPARRYCCGNGVVESNEQSSGLCDGNW